MDPEQLRKRIAAFPRWTYRFEFDDDVSTPVSDRGRINRQHERHALFFARLLALTGGSLRGMRVLDLGCSSGFFSLAAAEAGADFVMGVDLKEEYIEQAELVFEAKGIAPERYEFRAGDLFETQLGDRFDVVLCLGVIDQLDRPAELFELIAATNAALVVIDTKVSRSRESLFELSRLYNTRDVAGDGLVLVPSRQAVLDLAERHGFTAVALAQDVGDYAGMSDYRRERRCAFICSRGADLAGLPVEKRPTLLPWWARDPRALTGS
jgi:SAM-dependent methyltransferase